MIATTDWLMVLLRLLHIVSGVFWVGSVFMFVWFVQPSAAAIAPAGAPFLAELLGKRRLVDRIMTLGAITVLAGLVLYWNDWHDYPSFADWFSTHFGLALTIGGLCAIAAFAIGIFVTRPGVQRMLALGRQAADAGGPPSPEVMAEMGSLQHRLALFGRIGFWLLAAAILLMSTGRYL